MPRVNNAILKCGLCKVEVGTADFINVMENTFITAVCPSCYESHLVIIEPKPGYLM